MSEEKKITKKNLLDLASAVGNAAKNTATVFGTATKNVAVTVAENVKESSEQIKQQHELKKLESDKERLAPIFEHELTGVDFCMPTVVCIVDDDKRRYNKACEGAVGFWLGKDIKVLCIYHEFAHLLGLRFYPLLEDAAYHVDPCFNDLYIRLDEYFTYLKKMRVDELTAVAQDLGAKHVEITLRATKVSAEQKDAAVGFSAQKGITIGGEAISSRTQKEFVEVKVAAKTDFVGNDTPVAPKLIYFKNESDINALVKMRLDPTDRNKILSKTYELQCKNSSGIKTSDAQKIDATLGSLGGGAQRSFSNETANENSTVLEYTIVF